MGNPDNLDLEHRDVNQLNTHITVAFEEVFGEPDTIHAMDGVWKCSYKCYNCTLSCCYKVLTIFCAVPLAFCWACEFACQACCHIWYLTPMVRNLAIDMAIVGKIYRIILNAVVGPICETFGLCFSKINVSNN